MCHPPESHWEQLLIKRLLFQRFSIHQVINLLFWHLIKPKRKLRAQNTCPLTPGRPWRPCAESRGRREEYMPVCGGWEWEEGMVG